MDPLSDVLRAVRLNGAYFYLVEAGIGSLIRRWRLEYVRPLKART